MEQKPVRNQISQRLRQAGRSTVSLMLGSSLCRLAAVLTLALLVPMSAMFVWLEHNCAIQPLSFEKLPKGFDGQRFNAIVDPKEKPKVLLWVWPENYRFDFSDCQTFFNIDGCHLTDDRSQYEQSDAVIVYHRGISWDLSNLPPSPRPQFQQWIWLHLEPPSNTRKIPGLENLFNLTLSYRRDADITVRNHLYAKKTTEEFEIPKKDKLVCWIVSSNAASTGVSRRNRYYQELKQHIHVHMFGKAYGTFLDYNSYYPTIASCKFYLSFENSIHMDYITEKMNGPLSVGTVPVVLGPPRKNYENFYPGNSFIHVDDFPDAKSLADHLLRLDKDDEAYGRFFSWRRYLSARPHLIQRNQEFILPICTACQFISKRMVYKEAHDIYKWYFN